MVQAVTHGVSGTELMPVASPDTSAQAFRENEAGQVGSLGIVWMVLLKDRCSALGSLLRHRAKLPLHVPKAAEW